MPTLTRTLDVVLATSEGPLTLTRELTYLRSPDGEPGSAVVDDTEQFIVSAAEPASVTVDGIDPSQKLRLILFPSDRPTQIKQILTLA